MSQFVSPPLRLLLLLILAAVALGDGYGGHGGGHGGGYGGGGHGSGTACIVKEQRTELLGCSDFDSFKTKWFMHFFFRVGYYDQNFLDTF
jgi:hypothetical protein